ncbi:MAG: hypothetical protein ACRCT8_01450 [Lacipirellulaceae bacterium]
MSPRGSRSPRPTGGGYSTPHETKLLVGVQAGCVYRFRAEGVPGFPGVAVYPTVELLDRLYAPVGKADEFPVPIELTLDDLRIAAQGGLVTRVVYVEDPRTALPIDEQRGGQQWFEAPLGDDPLVLADELGRPIAIVRIGSRETLAPNETRFATAIERAAPTP